MKVECILVTTHLDCLSFTTRIAMITMEITSPITAIANSIAKAIFTPLSSELQSQLLSLGGLLVAIKNKLIF